MPRGAASQYNADWRGYQGKAERLLLRDLAGQDDGDWIKLGQIYNVGPKFLRWMVDNRLIERRHCGTSCEALKSDWYRVTPRHEWFCVPPPDDFGDLWVSEHG